MLVICHDNQVLVISDEIHHDLILSGHKFTSTLEIKDGFYRDVMVMVDAPSKTFNLAALNNCHVVIPNPQLRDLYDQKVAQLSLPAGTLMGHVAGQAAYESGQEWLECMLEVIEDNYKYVKEELTTAFPQIKIADLQGTYLMWINLSGLMAKEDVEYFVKKKAGLAVDFGDWFGPSGLGHIRMNLATKPENIQKAVKNLITHLKEISK